MFREMAQRRSFLRLLLALCAMLWNAACRRTESAETDEEEDGTEAPPQRLVTVHNPATGKTHLLDLERLSHGDGAEPLPLADGTDPFADRFLKTVGPPVDFPVWLKPPPGSRAKDEQAGPASALSATEAYATRYVTYEVASAPAAILGDYRAKALAAGWQVLEEGHLGNGLSLSLGSANGLESLSFHAYQGREIWVGYTQKQPGSFPYEDPFPHLELDRFDAEAQVLYLIDRSTGQRFRVRREVMEAEDESPRDIQVEPARLPGWLTRYPGAKVEWTSGAMVADGVRHEGINQENLLASAPFDLVVRYYRDLVATRPELKVAGESRGQGVGDDIRFLSLMIEPHSGRAFYVCIGVQESKAGTQIQLSFTKSPAV